MKLGSKNNRCILIYVKFGNGDYNRENFFRGSRFRGCTRGFVCKHETRHAGFCPRKRPADGRLAAKSACLMGVYDHDVCAATKSACITPISETPHSADFSRFLTHIAAEKFHCFSITAPPFPSLLFTLHEFPPFLFPDSIAYFP